MIRDTPLQQKTIGLVGGCSDVATAAYYAFLNEIAKERLGGDDIAETLIAGMNFGNVRAFVDTGNWAAYEAYIASKVDQLIAGGADLILCVSNTTHKAFVPAVEARNVPYIHIADPTGRAINAAGLVRVILFGTQTVMEETYIRQHYEEKYGLEIIIPDSKERADINRIIFEELVHHQVRESSRARYLEIARRLVDEERAEGLILGCTEIFTLLDQPHWPALPMFNTGRLHCAAAMDFALSDTPS